MGARRRVGRGGSAPEDVALSSSCNGHNGGRCDQMPMSDGVYGSCRLCSDPCTGTGNAAKNRRTPGRPHPRRAMAEARSISRTTCDCKGRRRVALQGAEADERRWRRQRLRLGRGGVSGWCRGGFSSLAGGLVATALLVGDGAAGASPLNPPPVLQAPRLVPTTHLLPPCATPQPRTRPTPVLITFYCRRR